MNALRSTVARRLSQAVRDGSFNLLFNENFGPAEARDLAAAIAKVERHFVRP